MISVHKIGVLECLFEKLKITHSHKQTILYISCHFQQVDKTVQIADHLHSHLILLCHPCYVTPYL